MPQFEHIVQYYWYWSQMASDPAERRECADLYDHYKFLSTYGMM